MVPKVAVLVAGPFRYAHLVLLNLEAYLREIDFDAFFHIWKTDLGNKRRTDEAWLVEDLLSNARTKAVILAEPLPESFYSSTIGTETCSNSTINATMGMFYSMSTLCSYLQQQPNLTEYSHCLRMRTDCAIISPRFVDKLDFDPQVLTVAKSFDIPHGWISDFITFGARRPFFDLWHHPTIDSIYKAYRRGRRNPERTLAFLARKRLRGIKISETLVQRDDFTIVYSPPPAHEPLWIRETISEHGTEALFVNPERFRNEAEIAEVNRRGEIHCKNITPTIWKETLKLIYRVRVAIRGMLDRSSQ
jgi:hypothetical protein